MNKKTLIGGVMFAFSVFLGSVMVNQPDAYADKTRCIRVSGGDSYSIKTLKLDPEILHIDKGDIVVWRNWARAREVKVVFEEEKVYEDVAEAAAFKPDAKRCVVTSCIPQGGKSSLRFTQQGRYKYIIETAGGGVKAQGEVLVTID